MACSPRHESSCSQPCGIAFTPLLLLLLLAAAIAFAWVQFRPSGGDTAPALSLRQQLLVRQFGPPQAFVLTFDEADDGNGVQPLRAETWCYQDNLTSFSFVNGEFCGSSRSRALPAGSAGTPYRPEQFRSGMTPTEVQAALALPALADLRLDELGLQTPLPRDLKFCFAPQLLLGFANDRLHYVETFPSSPVAGTAK